MKPGIYPNMTYESYAAVPAARSSILSEFRRSPLHARAAMLQPRESSKVQDLGTGIHCAILEPARFEKLYAISPKCDRRTKEGKEIWANFIAANAGKEILDSRDYDRAMHVREAVWSQPWAEYLLGGKGAVEVSAFWTDAELSADCKARLDRYTADFDGLPTVVDVKSSKDASEEAFRRSIASYDYHVQAAFYLDGLTAIQDHFRRFIWLAVEKDPPYATALYEPSDEMLEEGRRRYKAALAQLSECQRTNHWPGYPPSARMIDLPPWMKKTNAHNQEIDF